jgi:hypothetical protein
LFKYYWIKAILGRRQLNIRYSLDLPPFILTMKMLGCLGAGSFGKVYKVEVGGELYALKKVAGG